MVNTPARPYFPAPPLDYNPRYLAEIVREFSVFVAQIQNPGEALHSSLGLTGLPTSEAAAELAVGTVYNDNGILRIVTRYIARPIGQSGIGYVGDVTITVA